jgi:transposase-like protein
MWMPQRRRKFSAEFKTEAVRMVIEQSRPIAQVAREINVVEGTLGKWVTDYRDKHAGEEPPLSLGERAQLRELKKENAELRMRTEFLGRAAACWPSSLLRFFASSLRNIGKLQVRVYRWREGELPDRARLHDPGRDLPSAHLDTQLAA